MTYPATAGRRINGVCPPFFARGTIYAGTIFTEQFKLFSIMLVKNCKILRNFAVRL